MTLVTRRRVLVTGATGGLGAAVVERLAHEGYLPIAACREERRGAAQELAVKSKGSSVVLDLMTPASIETAVAEIAASQSPLHGLVHCASPKPVLARLGKITEADMAAFWQANVEGPRRLLSGLAKHCFHRSHGGVVIAVLTAAMGQNGRGATPGMGAYTISKYGFQGVLALLAAEVPWIRVETLMPGFIDTGMLGAFDIRFIDGLREKGGIASTDKIADDIVERLANPGKPEIGL
jgi:3-oxoacyl-[acyl-carrier protein] reductase